ncbi:MAG: murein transglycosylase A [Buchnera aphidicola (Schlechtendalia chinensis)]
MKNKIIIVLITSILSLCSFKKNNSEKVHKPNVINNTIQKKNLNTAINGKISNLEDVLRQIQKIKKFSPKLYNKNIKLYKSVNKWLKFNRDIKYLKLFGINLFKLKNINNYGNIKITSYYTPIIHAKKRPEKKFQYPIYAMPSFQKKYNRLPNRKNIYNGILKKKYILAYSNSLVDNFIMEIQGSGIVDYGFHKPLTLFKYSGENGWPYKSIGNFLIKNGDIKKEDMSMKSIIKWFSKHTSLEAKHLLEINNSFVFFKQVKNTLVCGSSSVPLIAKTSIATDKNVIKPGNIILAQIPILDEFGKFNNKYENRILISLDVGGSIKGQKIDIYQGIGKHAGIKAGFYNHYGYVWILK